MLTKEQREFLEARRDVVFEVDDDDCLVRLDIHSANERQLIDMIDQLDKWR